MLPFIKKSIVFIAGFLVVIFVLQTIINFAVKSINVGEYGVFNKINEGKINADILISGSSRALKAINPKVIEKELGLTCYNIASDGSDLGVQLPKLKWYLENNKTPKILIQDIAQFGGDISNTIYEPFKYLPYLSNDSLFKGLERIDPDIWYNKYLFPVNLIYYNFDFYAKLGIELIQSFRDQEKYINGFLPDNSKWSSNFEQYKKEHPDGINCSAPQDYKAYISELIKYCRQNKIILVFIVLPNYYRLKEVTHNLKDIGVYYNSLSEPFVYYYDYSNSDISKNEKYLYNFTHLNLDGANYFTKLLTVELKNIKY